MPQKIVRVLVLACIMLAEAIGYISYRILFTSGYSWFLCIIVFIIIALTMNVVVPGILLSTIPWIKADKEHTRAVEENEKPNHRLQEYVTIKLVLLALLR